METELEQKPNDFLESILQDDTIDTKTKEFMSTLKNPVFMENVFDLEKNLHLNLKKYFVLDLIKV